MINKIELNEMVEEQLEEILKSRPNEEREITRRNDKIVEVKKNALRGYGFAIDNIVENKANEIKLNNNEYVIDEGKEQIRYSVNGIDTNTSFYMNKMSENDLNEKYHGFDVTQEVDSNGMVSLKYSREGWVAEVCGKKLYSTFLRTATPDISNIRSFEGSLMEFRNEISYIYDEKTSTIFMDYLINALERTLKEDLMKDVYNSLNDKELQILRKTKEGYAESRWTSKVYVSRKRSELKNYMRKELMSDGDFGLLHNKVDLFEETEYVY